jgi:hypothetical protein
MCTASSIVRVVRKSSRVSAQPTQGMNTTWSPASRGSAARCSASAAPARSAREGAPSDPMPSALARMPALTSLSAGAPIQATCA